MATVWISGPSKDLCVAAEQGDIPAHFKKRNREEMPVTIFYWQATLFTLLALVFLIMPNINESYWILIALTAELYMIMYFILFVTGLRMRYKYPDVVRSYRIPGKGNLGMWIASGAGIVGTSTAFCIGFIPPAEHSGISTFHFDLLLLGGIFIICVPAMLLFSIRHAKLKKKP
jgi:amino acid transporter